MNSKGNMTAVKWLINELFNELTVVVTKENNPALFEVIEKAKQMEKEQTMQDYSVGYSNGQVDSNRTAEQYYNETFKSE